MVIAARIFFYIMYWYWMAKCAVIYCFRWQLPSTLAVIAMSIAGLGVGYVLRGL